MFLGDYIARHRWCQSWPSPPLSCMLQKVAEMQLPSTLIPPCRKVRCAHTPHPPCSPGEEGPQMHHCFLCSGPGVLWEAHQLKDLVLEDLAGTIGCVHIEIHLHNLWANRILFGSM